MLSLLLASGLRAEGRRPGHDEEKQVVSCSVWQQSKSSAVLFRNQGREGWVSGPLRHRVDSWNRGVFAYIVGIVSIVLCLGWVCAPNVYRVSMVIVHIVHVCITLVPVNARVGDGCTVCLALSRSVLLGIL